MSYLNLKNIYKTFSSNVAVDDFSLDIAQGEFISFLGPSGCGKTTTLRMVAGFEYPTAGSIALLGNEITNLPPNKRNIGMVFQSYALFPNMTVAENIGFGLKVSNTNTIEIKARVTEALSLIHMQDLGGRYPGQLSGGQQQRVALARALAIKPKVLLLDEPLSALDAKIRLELRLEIRRIQKQLNMTTIYVTHDQEEALTLSDRIVVMNQGRVEQVDTPSRIYNYPSTEFVASFVGHINIFPVSVIDGGEGIVDLSGNKIRSRKHMQEGAIPVHMAVRPEELTPGHREGANNLTGNIHSVQYLGSVVRIQIDVSGNFLSMDLFNQRDLSIPMVGDRFDVNFSSDSCWLL
jgi:putative spermidine/putrescine transport system ATP-binding protein